MRTSSNSSSVTTALLLNSLETLFGLSAHFTDPLGGADFTIGAQVENLPHRETLKPTHYAPSG